jgi:hypothetical protein
MAYEYRIPADYMFGTLTSSVSLSDTTLSSAEFSNLRVISSNQTHTPITLLDPTARTYEIVWAITHTSGSSGITVLRGKESSVAQDWPAGTQWLCTPTVRDVVSNGFAATGMVADGHVGMRQIITDKGEVWSKTLFQGWMGEMRSSREDLGRCLDGTSGPPNGYVPMMKCLTALGNTNATGYLSVALPNGGFPTRLVTAAVTRANGNNFIAVLDPTFTTKTTVSVLAVSASNVAVANTQIGVGIIAVGY